MRLRCAADAVVGFLVMALPAVAGPMKPLR
jgi:hypothetical protein